MLVNALTTNSGEARLVAFRLAKLETTLMWTTGQDKVGLYYDTMRVHPISQNNDIMIHRLQADETGRTILASFKRTDEDYPVEDFQLYRLTGDIGGFDSSPEGTMSYTKIIGHTLSHQADTYNNLQSGLMRSGQAYWIYTPPESFPGNGVIKVYKTPTSIAHEYGFNQDTKRHGLTLGANEYVVNTRPQGIYPNNTNVAYPNRYSPGYGPVGTAITVPSLKWEPADPSKGRAVGEMHFNLVDSIVIQKIIINFYGSSLLANFQIMKGVNSSNSSSDIVLHTVTGNTSAEDIEINFPSVENMTTQQLTNHTIGTEYKLRFRSTDNIEPGIFYVKVYGIVQSNMENASILVRNNTGVANLSTPLFGVEASDHLGMAPALPIVNL
jgi:hypothetical protein